MFSECHNFSKPFSSIPILIFSSLILFSASLTPAFSQSSIDIEFDKQTYRSGDLVQISGVSSSSVVAVEVIDSTGETIVIRSLPVANGTFEFSFRIPNDTHGTFQVVSSATVDGQTVKSSKTFIVSQSVLNSNSVDPSDGGGCLIATAAYGTELAPQVQFLREVRDNTVMSTASGAAFMTGFNQFYYSFSPTIADMERENPMFQEAVRAFITPMVSTLSIMTLAENGSEVEVLGLGISVIALNLGIYVGLPMFGFRQLRKSV